MTSITIEVPDGYTTVKDGNVIRIEKLPEPPNGWMPYEGELIEVSDLPNGMWRPRYFKRYVGGRTTMPWATVDCVQWAYARPLSDPMIVQFRPHNGGECPCPGQIVVGMLRGGEIFTGASDSCSWSHNGSLSDIIGWTPVKEDK